MNSILTLLFNISLIAFVTYGVHKLMDSLNNIETKTDK